MSYDTAHGSDYDTGLSPEAGDIDWMGGAEFKVDLRWADGGRNRLTDQTKTPDATVALAAFRALLRREDLVGQDVAARFVVANRSLYYSNFSKGVGLGRIHPDAPIVADADEAQAKTLAAWRPPIGDHAVGGDFASSRDALLLAQLYEALSYSHGHLAGVTDGGAVIEETKARNERALKAAEEAGVLDVARALWLRP